MLSTRCSCTRSQRDLNIMGISYKNIITRHDFNRDPPSTTLSSPPKSRVDLCVLYCRLFTFWWGQGVDGGFFIQDGDSHYFELNERVQGTQNNRITVS